MLTAAERCSLLADAVNRPGEVELPEGVTANIGGRVCFATDEAGFEYLSNPTQPFPFIVGPDEVARGVAAPHISLLGLQRQRASHHLLRLAVQRRPGRSWSP